MKHRFIARVLLLIILLLNIVSAKGYATLTNEEIQQRLSKPYEQNADEIMELIRQQQFEEAEAFIEYVVKHDHVTRDGIRYFRAILGYWFYKPERIIPFPEDILPHLNIWVKQRSESAIAYIIRGTFYIDYAWKARGGGWAKDVPEEDWENFHERMRHARDDLMKASELNPHNPHSKRQLMRTHTSTDDSQEESLFQQVITRAPTFFWAYRARLNGLMPKWGGTWETMFAFAYETAENAPPKTLLPLILADALVEAAARSGDRKQFYQDPEVWEVLESVYKQVIDDFPLSSEWKVRFAEIAKQAGKNEIAMEYLKLAEDTDPNDYEIFEIKIALLEAQKDWEATEISARRLIQLRPTYSEGYAHLGFALSRVEQYEESAENFSKAIQFNPQKAWYWAIRCYDYQKLGKYQQIIPDCTKAIELDNNRADAYWNRAFAYEKLGNQEAAEADYEMAKKIREARN